MLNDVVLLICVWGEWIQEVCWWVLIAVTDVVEDEGKLKVV